MSSSAQGNDFFKRPPPLSGDADQLLSKAADDPRVHPRAFDALSWFLRTAPLREQMALSPLTLAKVTGERPADLVATMLACVDAGVLSLSFDILCPACRGPQPMTASSEQVHCTACNVRFDRTFPNAVVVSFRPSTALRPTPCRIECAGSPARQPHIVAQETIERGQTSDLSLILEPGIYQVRSLPPAGPPATIMVFEGLEAQPSALRLTHAGMSPRSVRMPPGHAPISVTNETAAPRVVTVAKQRYPAQSLTAGVMWEEFPAFQPYFPRRHFAEGRSFAGVVVAVTDPVTSQPAATAFLDGAHVVLKSQGTTIAAFDERARAYEMISQVLPMLETEWVGIAEGPIWIIRMGNREVPMGRTVEEALSVMHGAGPGNAATPIHFESRPEILGELERAGAKLRTGTFRGSKGERVGWLYPARGARISQP